MKFWIAAAMIFAAASLTAVQAAPKVLPISPKTVKAAPHAAPTAKTKVARVTHCRCPHTGRHRHHRMAQSWGAAKRYAESYYDYHSASTVTWYDERQQSEAVTLGYPEDFTGGVGYGMDGGSDYGSGGEIWIDGYGRRHFFMRHHGGHFRHGFARGPAAHH